MRQDKDTDGPAVEILKGLLSFMFMALIGWTSFLIGRSLPKEKSSGEKG